MEREPVTHAYVERRTCDGLSKRRIRRVLKRYIARQIYRLVRPFTANPASGRVEKPVNTPRDQPCRSARSA